MLHNSTKFLKPSTIRFAFFVGLTSCVLTASGQHFSVFEEVDRWPGIPTGDTIREVIPIAGNVILANDAGVGGSAYTIHAIDVADVENPSLAGSNQSYGSGAVVDGNRAYFRNGNGVDIVDISDFANMTLLGKYDVSYNDRLTLAYYSNHIYVLGPGGLHVVDVSDPAQPMQTTTIAPAIGEYDSVKFSGQHLFALRRGEYGIDIYDVTSPGTPLFVKTYHPDPGMSYIRSIAIEGSKLYAVEGTSTRPDGLFKFYVIDVSSPGNPAELNSFTSNDRFLDVQVSGNIAFLTRDLGNENFALRLVNVSDPLNLLVEPQSQFFGNFKMTAVEDRLYLDEDSRGVVVMDISHADTDLSNNINWGKLEEIGTLPIYADYNDLYFRGTRLLLPLGDAGVQLIQTLSEGRLNPRRRYFFDGWVNTVLPAGNYLHVGFRYPDNEYGDTYALHEFIGESLVRRGGVKSAEVIDDIAVANNYAVLAGQTEGYYIYDWSGRTNPVLKVKFKRTASAGSYGVEVSENYAYFAENFQASIVNLNDHLVPPDLQSTINTGGGAHDIHISGHRAFIPLQAQGVMLADIVDDQLQNSSVRTFANTLKYNPGTGGYVNAVTTYGNYAFLAMSGGSKGVVAIDVSDPANITQVASFSGSTNIIDIEVGAQYVYALDSSTGVIMIRWADDSAFLDFDNDGAIDSLENFFGSAPDIAGSNDGRLPPPQFVEENGEIFLMITFTVTADLDPNIHWELEAAATLNALFWDPVQDAQITQEGTLITARVPASEAGQKFVRLSIQIP